MPANSKYLTSSGWQRFSKISAGILGGYLVTMAIHLALAAWFKHTNVIITATFTGFMGWVGFMIIAFYAKSGWKVWLLYVLLTAFFSLIMWLGQHYKPNYMTV
jgi:hypothetical protein